MRLGVLVGRRASIDTAHDVEKAGGGKRGRAAWDMIDLFGPDSDDWDDDFGAELSDAVEVSCPYCGEEVEIAVDLAGGDLQEYVEDCAVCCQPWSVRVSVDTEGVPSVVVTTLDDG